jgi:HAD superfamily hydrolase (TIGR01490 family)
MAKYHLSLIDLQHVAVRLAAQMKGKLELEFADRCRGWVEQEVLPLVVPGARGQIERHRAEGHILAILSTSPTYVTRPLAEALGIEEVISTQFEVENGEFTGRLVGPACVGQGKVHWAEDLVTRREVDLAASWFYTDSYTDLPMLERVGNRVVVNPDPRLRRTAKRRGWPVQDWQQVIASSPPSQEVRA